MMTIAVPAVRSLWATTALCLSCDRRVTASAVTSAARTARSASIFHTSCTASMPS